MVDRRAFLSTSSAMILALCGRATAATGNAAAARLETLFEAFMAEQISLSPEMATMFGLDSGANSALKGRLSDASPKGIVARKALAASELSRLSAIDRKALTGLDAVNYDAVHYDLAHQNRINKRFAFDGAPYVISQLTGAYQSVPDFLDSLHAVENKDDADAYLSRLAAFAAQMDQECESVRHDVGLGVIPPDFAVAGALKQMEELRRAPAEHSILAASIARRTKEHGITGDYTAAAVRIVNDKVYPALDRQIALMKDVKKKAPHDAGVWRLPDGEAYYAAALEAQTTTTHTPADVHALGLDVVKKCTAEIDAIMKAHGMTKGSVGARLHAMFVDPKFIYPNTDAGKAKLIAELNRKVARVQALLPKYFGTRPKTKVVIKRVPPYIEASQAGGSYMNGSLDGTRPGIYYINLRDTAEVPSWTLPTLTYHESIPGHHLQISIAQETRLPLIRKVSQYNAYVEGWALYAEQLAVEMGLYDDDPFGHIGQLHDAMLRGVRLVVDTGMHAMHWSREKALGYYVDTLGDPESGAATEIERYCVWPGQACGYMIGKMAILDLRAKAKKALGAKFDIHTFHDRVLLSGALPLDVMAAAMAGYVSGRKA